MYSQKDIRWSWQQLGACKGTTIGKAGCLLTCMAQLLTNHKLTITPAQLNKLLVLTKGYVNECLIPDIAPQKLFPDYVKYLGRTEPRQPVDLSALHREPGEEIILKVDYNHNPKDGTQRHFIILKAAEGDRVLIADPIGGRVGDFRSWYGDPRQNILAVIKYRFVDWEGVK